MLVRDKRENIKVNPIRGGEIPPHTQIEKENIYYGRKKNYYNDRVR